MGQYYITVNLDKKQYLFPHKFDDGLKLMEFGCSSMGTMTGLAILLADGNGRGGGDLHSEDPIVGSWAGDRIVITGDYADPGKFLPKGVTKKKLKEISKKCHSEGYQEADRVNLYDYVREEFEDISYKVIEVLEKAGENIRSDKDVDKKRRDFEVLLRPDMMITNR